MKNKLTPWFPIETPPVRVGVYNVSCHAHRQTGHWYAYWDGRWFGFYYQSAQAAADGVRRTCRDATASWRGIAK